MNYNLTFDDVVENTWCTDAVRWAASAGIMADCSMNTFRPDDPLTREQLAAMLYLYETRHIFIQVAPDHLEYETYHGRVIQMTDHGDQIGNEISTHRCSPDSCG